MSILIIAAIALAVVLGYKTKINTGFFCIAFAYIIGCFMLGMKTKDLIAEWPTSTMFVILAVSLFYNFAAVNGTLEKMSSSLLYACRRFPGMLPYALFLVAVVLSVMGAAYFTVLAFLAPITMAICEESKMDKLTGAVAINCGALAGGNGTIRAILDGTVFRTPIMVKGISPVVKNWKKPITIARHAYGDVYKATEYRVPGPGRAELVFTGADGKEEFRQTVYDFECSGVLQGQYNKDSSIASFARSCFQYAIDTKQDLWFATKDTISKQYDHTFKDIFQAIFDAEYKAAFDALGIEYFYTLIDDAVARVIRSQGGFIWACKNYDGDVMSDMVSTAFGSLAMMTSVLVSPDGKYEYEAAHGTVTRHYYKYLKGEETSTNPVATLFAWTGALRKRGELDGIDALGQFADKLEAAAIATIEGGTMTKDLVGLWDGEIPARGVTSLEFIRAIRTELEKML